MPATIRRDHPDQGWYTPAGILRFEREPCVPGWRLVTDLDGTIWIEKSAKRDGPSSALLSARSDGLWY